MSKQTIWKRVLAAFLAAGSLCMSAAAAFTDAEGHWAEPAILKWSEEYDVIRGYGDGRVGPDDVITRGQFAGILDRFFQFQNIAPAETFSDIGDHYWEEAILKLNASGVYQGVGGGKAMPDSDITREQAVTMLGRAFQIVPVTERLPYEDREQIAEYAADYVAEFTANGYLNGNRTTRFRPKDAITRAEVISILDCMIERLVQTNETVSEDVDGTVMINSAGGASLENMTITGDLIIAYGVTESVKLSDVKIEGKIQNFSNVEPEIFITPEPLKPSDIYKPGKKTGETLIFEGKTVPIYKNREKNSFRNEDFEWDEDRIVYTGNDYKVQFGVDVSSWQKDIDWKKVAADGVNFAMIRIGIRGYGTGALLADNYAARNVKGAMDHKIEAGVYFFAQAVTIEEAYEEADFVIEQLKSIEEEGYRIKGPVCYDWEMKDSTYRVYGTSPEMATACAIAFCERIEEAGYTPMIYAGSYVSYIKYDQEAVAPYLFWYPEYKTANSENLAPTLIYSMNYWQFSDRCSVDGIDGRADVNLRFIKKK